MVKTLISLLLLFFRINCLKILVDSDYYPLSRCNIKNQSDYSGYEYELISNGLTQMKLFNTSNVTFQCIDTNAIPFEELLSNFLTKTDTVMLAGVTITADRIKAGHLFSMPTFRTGLVAMGVNTKYVNLEILPEVKSEIYLVIVIILLLCSLLTYLFESRRNLDFTTNNIFSGLARAGWSSYFLMFKIPLYKTKTNEGRFLLCIMIICSQLLFALIISTIIVKYIENVKSNHIFLPSELAFKKVATLEIYNDIINNNNANVVNFNMSLKTQLDSLFNKDFDYIVSDSIVVNDIVGSRCDLKLASIEFSYFSMGALISPSTSLQSRIDLQSLINRAIALSKNNITFIKDLETRYFRQYNTDCPSVLQMFFNNSDQPTADIGYEFFIPYLLQIVISLVLAIFVLIFAQKVKDFNKNRKFFKKAEKELLSPETEILRKAQMFMNYSMNSMLYESLPKKEIAVAMVLDRERDWVNAINAWLRKLYFIRDNKANQSAMNSSLRNISKLSLQLSRRTLGRNTLQREFESPKSADKKLKKN